MVHVTAVQEQQKTIQPPLLMKAGLTEAQAKEKLIQFGSNRLASGKKKNACLLFFSQFKDLLIIILLISTGISVLMGEITEAIAIITIVFLNAILGFLQEYRTERTLEAMKQLAAPEAQVIRDGRIQAIPADQLVPGDVIVLKAGCRIPADAVLLEAEGLAADESLITGESAPVSKQAAAASALRNPPSGPNRPDMVYMGTTLTKGRGLAYITVTGMATEMGKIAGMLHSIEAETTPLQKKLDQLGKYMAIGCVGVCAVVSLTGILRGEPILDMVITGLSLSVAAIPEGLPAIVTITLALAMGRILKKNALIRQLHAVETLGCANVICSDKTGTLTENKMTVKEILLYDRSYSIESGKLRTSDRSSPVASEPLQQLLQAAVLCNDAEMFTESGKGDPLHPIYSYTGDPTETALLAAGAAAGLTRPKLKQQWMRCGEIPFDSQRKMMSVTVKNASGVRYTYVKGAPDYLLNRCTKCWTSSGIQPMNPTMKKHILAQNLGLGEKAMRVLGFALRESSGDKPEETGLTFLGLSGMIDPPRREAFRAVKLCRQAGIRPVMISGDHKNTACAVAKQLDILREGDNIYTGAELDSMADEALRDAVKTASVFARVNPGHKLRIVRALKQNGKVVAMTGDGVNDAPAVKEANIGVAMGQNGTDVTREAAALILLDDNFATLVSAVEEGRVIYRNIRKSIRYLLSCNIGEVLTMFAGMLMGLPVALLPIQILLVNLATDGLPAIALGLEPPSKDIMKEKPRNTNDSVFSDGLLSTILFRGCLIGLTTLWVFVSVLGDAGLESARTAALLTLVMTQLFYLFECKEEHKNIFQINFFSNPQLIMAACSSVLIMALVVFFPPLQGVFRTVALTGRQLAFIFLSSCAAPILSAVFSGGRIFSKRAKNTEM